MTVVCGLEFVAELFERCVEGLGREDAANYENEHSPFASREIHYRAEEERSESRRCMELKIPLLLPHDPEASERVAEALNQSVYHEVSILQFVTLALSAVAGLRSLRWNTIEDTMVRWKAAQSPEEYGQYR